jgi:hypothetical protein
MVPPIEIPLLKSFAPLRPFHGNNTKNLSQSLFLAVGIGGAHLIAKYLEQATIRCINPKVF